MQWPTTQQILIVMLILISIPYLIQGGYRDTDTLKLLIIFIIFSITWITVSPLFKSIWDVLKKIFEWKDNIKKNMDDVAENAFTSFSELDQDAADARVCGCSMTYFGRKNKNKRIKIIKRKNKKKHKK